MCRSGANKTPVPDTGYAWFMVFISASCYMVGNGIAYSFGVLFAEFVDYFQSPHSKIALIGSILMAMMYFPCFITSALITCVGPRPVAFTGAALTMAGLALCFFASSVLHLYICLGITGLGCGFLVFAPFVAMFPWFRKRVGVACGLTMGVGTSAGMCVMAPLTQWLINTLGWKGTMLIISGIAGQCLILTLLIREAPDFDSKDSGEENNNEDRESLLKVPLNDHAEPSHAHFGNSFTALGSSLASLGSVASLRHNGKRQHKNGTTAPNAYDANADKKPAHKLFFSIIRDSLDLSVFKDCKVSMMWISEVSHVVLYITPSIFLPDKAMSFGIKPTHAALLLSVVAAGSAIFSPLLGLLADTLPNHRPYISAAALVFISTVNICSMFMTTYPLFVFYAIVSGMQMAIIGSVTPLIFRDIAGSDNHRANKVLSWWYVASGFSALIAGPFLGALYDWTKTYDASFIAAGTFGFITVAFLLAIANLDRCCSFRRRSPVKDEDPMTSQIL